MKVLTLNPCNGNTKLQLLGNVCVETFFTAGTIVIIIVGQFLIKQFLYYSSVLLGLFARDYSQTKFFQECVKQFLTSFVVNVEGIMSAQQHKQGPWERRTLHLHKDPPVNNHKQLILIRPILVYVAHHLGLACVKGIIHSAFSKFFRPFADCLQLEKYEAYFDFRLTQYCSTAS